MKSLSCNTTRDVLRRGDRSRVGGRYRITNLLPDGATIAIEGEFRSIERPHKLVYTWRMDDGTKETSLVTVRFEPNGDETEIVIVHEQIPNDEVRVSHEKGWVGCLDGLESYARSADFVR